MRHEVDDSQRGAISPLYDGSFATHGIHAAKSWRGDAGEYWRGNEIWNLQDEKQSESTVPESNEYMWVGSGR